MPSVSALETQPNGETGGETGGEVSAIFKDG